MQLKAPRSRAKLISRLRLVRSRPPLTNGPVIIDTDSGKLTTAPGPLWPPNPTHLSTSNHRLGNIRLPFLCFRCWLFFLLPLDITICSLHRRQCS
ncbi:hypothetical protein LSTR_LSTR014197 [Laodelphax striatellus]|uniref:Uncharacterized protein n=1 Tax=Laodelphax striatellus TaxID=195883 RepID=A0A482XET3_LAOST|nr:hypothetical protein LSTR_LSTR014197 [Laodelphax striatellus]